MTLEMGPKSVEELQAAALKLIGIIYEAAIDPERWNDFLKVYSGLYPDTSQWIWLEDRQGGDVRLLLSEACDASFVASYQAHYAASNPWTKSLFSQPEGYVHLGDWNAPREVLEASEFYNDWLVPQDLHDGFGATILKSDRHLMIYSLLHSRSIATGLHDLELLKLLVPHMQRAARLHGHFLGLKCRAGASEDLLNQLSIGALLCDETGRILMMNTAAEKMIHQDDGLNLRAGRLIPARKAEADQLVRLLGEAAGMAENGLATAGSALAISRPSERRAFNLVVAPYRAGTSWSPWIGIEPATRIAIFIADPEAHQEHPEDLLARLYGLTSAEARLTSQLARGRPLGETAETCGITYETARSHLKTIFGKTGTHGQSELVHLIMSGPAGLLLCG